MFFITKDTVPDGMGFSTFGPMHLIWLACIIACIITAAMLYKRLGEKQRGVMRIVIGFAIIFLEVSKDIFHGTYIRCGEGDYRCSPQQVNEMLENKKDNKEYLW